MEKEGSILVGISIGDLNGIGGEIVLKTFKDSRMLELFTPIVFASTKVLSFQNKQLGINTQLFGVDRPEKVHQGKLNVVNVWKEPVSIEFGVESSEIGAYSIKSLKAATQALKEGSIDVLVTAPINKHNVQSDEFTFPGHTDYLAKELGGESLMLMISDDLRVGLLTDHVPVKEIVNTIDSDLIRRKAKIVKDTLIQDFGIPKPKIAVLGINPHTGDGGVIGDEDDLVLRPALEALRDQGMLIYGPYAADSFFGSNTYKAFDAILASYHDQGLIPFKTLSFGKGVNYTAGLSKIRTSPDHGTAYEIAGKGIADPSSFIEAVFSAIRIYRQRKEYLGLSRNKLKKQPVPVHQHS